MTHTDDLAPYAPTPYVTLQHPEWTRSATLYELNTRQMTPEGTFRAAVAHLPRIRDLGVDILWLMPVHTIGAVNRKGPLGSPYAIADHRAVNPELGTLDDLRHFVAEAHALGMRVILDWVANHTAWDHVLAASHPEWYARDWKGDFRPTPWWDWSDIIDLDYRHPGLRREMTDAMAFWVREADVDGFRCDVAGFVPVDVWEQARRELDAIKPVFLLAEWESRDLHAAAFDATYAWSWHKALRAAVAGHGLGELFEYYSWRERAYPAEAQRLTFVTNHDMNAWEGTTRELLGDAMEAAIVLSVVGDGMPLLYCGEEAGNDRRLPFFERDPIRWRDHPTGDLYRRLFALKHAHRPLWNAPWGATMVRIPTDDEQHVLTFFRGDETGAVVAALNFSDAARTVTLGVGPHPGAYTDAFTGEAVVLDGPDALSLGPWGFRVLTRTI
jgi:glycosidase